MKKSQLRQIIREEINKLSPKLNDNFWRWFGNSKVVDSKGNPLVVYRTQKKQYSHPSGITLPPYKNKEDSAVFGIYFSENPESTKIYGDTIESYFVKMENPLILRGFEYDEPWIYSIVTKDKYLDLKSKGYDGAIWNKDGEMYELVIFNRNQVKSTNNKGTWDNTDNIYTQ